jgi:predicted deacetylase
MVQYLIRLDDLCPTNNLTKWQRFFNLCDDFGIKPIIAVIPYNVDPKLLKCGNYNPDYWQLVRELQRKGYTIGMHGYEHLYQSGNSGLLRMNNRSEFAGLPLIAQEAKIKQASEKFKQEGVVTSCFIAPAHTFDINTLIALKKHSYIKTISDGLLNMPYKRFGFDWIPAQLSEVAEKKAHTWTFNYHPETCTDKGFYNLEKFIVKHYRHFVSADQLTFKEYTRYDSIKEQTIIYRRLFHDKLKLAAALLKFYAT